MDANDGSFQMIGPGLQKILHYYEQGPGGGVALKVYPDSSPRRWPTIGWGHKLLPGESFPNGITPEQADALLLADATKIGTGLAGLLSRQPAQQQWDALLSLAYNSGWAALSGMHIITYFNAGDDAKCAGEFPKWNHSAGVVEAGLTYRRHTEQTLYTTGQVIFYHA